MTNKIEQFLNKRFGEIRATKIDGVIWFVAADIAKVLKFSSTQKVTDKVEKEDIIKMPKTQLTFNVDWENSGGKDIVLMNEGGLYQVIVSITKRDMNRYSMVKDFKLWITNEVMPTLRETGAYVESGREEEVVDKYFNGLSEETKLLIFKELQANNQKLQVKAKKFDQFLDTESTYTFEEVAKMLSTKAEEEYGLDVNITKLTLPKYLREKGILVGSKKGKGYSNLPVQKYEQYFDVVAVKETNSNFDMIQTRIKPTGIEFIYDEMVLDEFQLN